MVRRRASAVNLVVLLAASGCGTTGSSDRCDQGAPTPSEPSGTSELTPTTSESDQIAGALRLVLEQVPGAAQRVAAMGRGFRLDAGGRKLSTPALTEKGQEVWVSAELEVSRPGEVLYRYRNSPRLWLRVHSVASGSGGILRLDHGTVFSGDARTGVRRILLAADRVVEDFWIADAPSGMFQPHLMVEAGPGIKAMRPVGGRIVAYDQDDEPRFEIDRATVFDAISTRVESDWSLTDDGGGRYELSARVDADKLVYPVLIDPTIGVPTWVKKAPLIKPPPIVWPMATFDSGRSRVVIHGGYPNGASPCTSDTWEWDGTIWDNRSGGWAPTGRSSAMFSYDPSLKQSILFGGDLCAGPAGTGTYGWDGTTWSTLTSTNAPTGWRWGQGGDYDPVRNVTVMFGDGYLGDIRTYEYKANVGWATFSTSSYPAGGALKLFYDTSLNRSIVFTSDGTHATWGWNGLNWITYSPSHYPSTRQSFSMAFDKDRKVGVLYGGQDGCCTTYYDTYEWYGMDWHYVVTTSHPTTHRSGGMAYDSTRQEMVHYGGSLYPNGTDETWVYKVLQKLTDGESCTSNDACYHGYCVDGVCCNSSCGGGLVDCQACSVAAGAASDGTCSPVSAGTPCRAAAGVCDVAESCDGSTAFCPSNAFQPATFVCRAAGGICDQPETCTGYGATCPSDSFKAYNTPCRPAAGACDVAESCTGASADCPVDGFRPSSTICRAAAGICDTAESCTGAGADCPQDGFKPPSTTCRPAAGSCDAAETCSGSAADCPIDMVLPASTVCRASAGACDMDETCTGAGVACPADAYVSAGVVCRSAVDICDHAEVCTGGSAQCPDDAFAPTTTVCRSAAGMCDVEETCSGSSSACPADGLLPSSHVCRAANGSCDLAESCTGSSVDCPPDVFEPGTKECRPKSGDCDVPESCTGTSAECPDDVLSSLASVCRTSTGECDTAEYCTGSSNSCPVDSVAPDGTECSLGTCSAGLCAPPTDGGVDTGAGGFAGNAGQAGSAGAGGVAGNAGQAGSAGMAGPSSSGGASGAAGEGAHSGAAGASGYAGGSATGGASGAGAGSGGAETGGSAQGGAGGQAGSPVVQDAGDGRAGAGTNTDGVADSGGCGCHASSPRAGRLAWAIGLLAFLRMATSNRHRRRNRTPQSSL